jgi:DNA mismatch repair protein MutS
MRTDAQLSPMMSQYRRIKSELPRDALLLFRLGDFYEMFFEDAQLGASLLNLALTRRQGVPMCGLPFHAAQGYIARLLKAGHKVAICDQLEDARPGKLVKREVTQILSPGTHFDERMLLAERNNYLAAISQSGRMYGLALVDLTTATFRVTELEGDAALSTELERVRPAEIIFPGENGALRTLLQGVRAALHGHEDWAFAMASAEFVLRDQFAVVSLDGFGLRDKTAAIGAAGGALHYLTQHLRRDVAQLTTLTFYSTTEFLHLDAASLRNLEILEPVQRDQPGARSLCTALQRTATPMGARLLREWMSQPLANTRAIARRQEAVSSWLASADALAAFRTALHDVRDLERTLGRLSSGSGNARDMVALRCALEQVPPLREHVLVADQPPPEHTALWEKEQHGAPEERSLIHELAAMLSPEPELVELIQRAIVDDPPAGLKEGGLFKDGYHA